MAVKLLLLAESGELTQTADGKSTDLKFVALGSDDPDEVLRAVLLETPPTIGDMGRTQVGPVRLQGGGVAFCDVGYDTGTPAAEAIGPDGVPGGDGSPGGGEGGGDGGGLPGGSGGDGSPSVPTPKEDDPLDSTWSFTTGGGTAHYTQSFETMERVGEAPDVKRAVGASGEGVEGVDVRAAKFELSVTFPRKITRKYIDVLRRTTCKTNADLDWLGFTTDECLLVNASGQGGKPLGSVSLTFEIGEKLTAPDPDLEVAPGLTLSEKAPHEYVWCRYKKTRVDGDVFLIPKAAYRERVYRRAKFKDLGIG